MIDKVGVIGSGLMGSEIALVFALAGKQVKLSDNNPEALQRALDSLGKGLGKGVQRGFYKPDETAAGWRGSRRRRCSGRWKIAIW
jgi:3-hydroxybutyryl-CoA dehydrogenase